MKKRKICFVVTSKIHYARSKIILSEIKKRDNLELQIVVGASAILSQYGDVLEQLHHDGFDCDAKITMTLEGGSPVAMAKTAGIGITEFATVFDNLQPDVVIVRGDRYEVLSAAVAAAYLNIPVAHIEGGDVTGTIDESVRHAVTKLSHIHFTTNQEATERVIRMGENPRYVFHVGCPSLEYISKNNFTITNETVNNIGVGDKMDIDKPYLIVMQHPVTSEISQNRKHTVETLEAIHQLGIPTFWFWPNVDAGSDEISKAIRVFRENKDSKNIRFVKSLTAEEFAALLRGAKCLVGNSSAGIKEASFLGVPAVNIGTRQQGRKRGDNVIDVDFDKTRIKEAVVKQINHGSYPPSNIYYKENTSKSIVDVLSSVELYTQKKFFE